VWLTWEVDDSAGWVVALPGGCSREAAIASCQGHWREQDGAARVQVGRTTGSSAARCNPEDHNGGDACIGYLGFNGEVLAA